MKWQPSIPPYQPPVWTPPPYLRPGSAPDPAPYTGGPTIDVTPTHIEVHQPPGIPTPPTPSLEGIPTITHSRINLADFVRHKVAPTPPSSHPYVDSMHWHFDEPQDEHDHEVRLYFVLSQEERATVKRWGLQHHAFEQEQLFDDEALENLQEAQQAELAQSPDEPRFRASLAIEHKQQLAIAREAKVDITIEHFLAYPYIKRFENRYAATNGQRKLTGTINNIRKMLEDHRAR